ncbi:MAG: HEAT repeat domain-containing protein [Sedimentisphaerales bacterium]|nr:HEAT repeat domain-containing protein [Sedimentisphaerales bacterium]
MKTNCIVFKHLVLLILPFYSICFAASEQAQNDAIETVLGILRSGDPQMQAVAITMIRQMQGKELTEALVKELPNLPVTGQVQLLTALGDRGDKTALPVVINVTKSKEVSIRIAALKALGQLGNASCTILLAEIAANSIGEEQKAARDSLYGLRDMEADKEILAHIPTAEPKVKVELIRSIGQRNITTAVETLFKTAHEPETGAQQESFKALEAIANENQMPELIKLLMSVDDDTVREQAERTVAVIALKSGDKASRCAVVLSALAVTKDSQDRCSLLRVLGRIGDDNALSVIRASVNSNDAQEQDTAIRVLSNWPNHALIDDLLKIAKSSKNRTHRILALRGFVRLIGLDANSPAEEIVMMYKQAMELSEDVSEKRLVLSGLAKVKSLSALEITASYLSDAALKPEAEAAVVKISENIYADYPQQTKDVLNKIIQTSKNETLRQKAQEIIKTTDEGRGM